MPVACVYCRAGTDKVSADVMFLPDVLAWPARSAFYLYGLLKYHEFNVILLEKLVF